MKILHLNYSDHEGGASIAAYRIHKALLNKNFNSEMLVVKKHLNEKEIITRNRLINSFLSYTYDGLSRNIIKLFDKKEYVSKSLSIFPTFIHKKINKINPDIVNIHWIGNSTISIEEISKIKAPILWTMHDMWPFCSIEHLSEENYFKYGYSDYSKKNFLFSNLKNYIWTKKKNCWNKKKIKIICTSEWMYRRVQDSSLFKKNKIAKIPIFLDKKVFLKKDELISKKKLGIDNKKKIIGFISQNILNPNKRFNFFYEAIKNLKKKYKNNFQAVVLGDYNNLFKLDKELDIKIFNKNTNQEFLDNFYSSLDALVVCSKIESFSQTSLEAQFYGVPTVSFNNLGLSEFINHKVNGFLSKDISPEGLCEGLEWILKKDIKKENLRKQFDKLYNIEKYMNDYLNFIND